MRLHTTPHDHRDETYRLFTSDKEEVKTVWFALESYLSTLEKDRDSRYNGNPSYSAEDEEFLVHEINKVRKLRQELAMSGIKRLL